MPHIEAAPPPSFPSVSRERSLPFSAQSGAKHEPGCLHTGTGGRQCRARAADAASRRVFLPPRRAPTDSLEAPPPSDEPIDPARLLGAEERGLLLSACELGCQLAIFDSAQTCLFGGDPALLPSGRVRGPARWSNARCSTAPRASPPSSRLPCPTARAASQPKAVETVAPACALPLRAATRGVSAIRQPATHAGCPITKPTLKPTASCSSKRSASANRRAHARCRPHQGQLPRHRLTLSCGLHSPRSWAIPRCCSMAWRDHSTRTA